MGGCLNTPNNQYQQSNQQRSNQIVNKANVYHRPQPQSSQAIPQSIVQRTPAPQQQKPSPNPLLGTQQHNFNITDLKKRYGPHLQIIQQQTISVKIPSNLENTQYVIISQPLVVFPPNIINYPISVIKKLCMQEKLTWLRINVEKIRISWQLGCELLQINRNNLLMSSLEGLSSMNLRKELKIRIDDEEVDDAGGVLRQWMHLCMQEIFNSQIHNIFKLCNTTQTAYRFIQQQPSVTPEDEYKMQIIHLLGLIIGKAIFDRIPLDCFLTRSIWRIICGGAVTMGDFYSYDKQMWSGLVEIMNEPQVFDMFMNFTYMYGQEKVHKKKEVQLIKNGAKVDVTNQNKGEYVNLLINFLCRDSCKKYIDCLRNGINTVIPISLISIFEPHQLQILLNGPQKINLKQWQQSCLYLECTQQQPLIRWFWSYLHKQDNEKLSNLLHFVTGSRRVPILGFFFLESNRNNINRFTIKKVKYESKNPFPKGHTCFNRLQLPSYQSQLQLITSMDNLLQHEINTFGLS